MRGCSPGWALTAHFVLAVLQRLQHRLGQAEPGQLLAELRQQVMREEAHGPSQRIQHETQRRLQEAKAGAQLREQAKEPGGLGKT